MMKASGELFTCGQSSGLNDRNLKGSASFPIPQRRSCGRPGLGDSPSFVVNNLWISSELRISSALQKWRDFVRIRLVSDGAWQDIARESDACRRFAVRGEELSAARRQWLPWLKTNVPVVGPSCCACQSMRTASAGHRTPTTFGANGRRL